MPARLRRIALIALTALSVSLTMLAGLILLRPTAWPFELLNHFVMMATLLSVATVVTAILLDTRSLVIACLFTLATFVAIFNRSYDLVPWNREHKASISPSLHLAVHSSSLTIVTHNVYCRNWNEAGFRSWLASRPADIIVLVEISAKMIDKISDMSDVYPYLAKIPVHDGQHSGCQGVLVLSMLPITTSRVFQPLKEAWPGLILRLERPEGDFWLAAVHASDPVRQLDLGRRDRFFEALAIAVENLGGPLIIAGDFNATPFTPAFQRLVSSAHLAQPNRPVGSYPARFGGFGLPIDHILARHAIVRDVEALVGPGSDHRPLRARIDFPGHVP